MQHSPSTSAYRPRPRVHAALLHLQCANRPFWPLVSKYTIFDVLYYYEYSDTNISKFLFHENSFLNEEAKHFFWLRIEISICFSIYPQLSRIIIMPINVLDIFNMLDFFHIFG